MAVVGEAFVKISPDGAGFSAKAEQQMMGSVAGLAKKAALVFASGFVIDKAATAFVESIGLASDLSESTSKAGVVFGDFADEVERFASTAPTALGQTRAQALEATGTFGNLLRAVGLTEETSAQFSTSMVGLASDLASFNNTDPAEALDALRAGLVGETEPLKRFGVNMNEALLKQKAMELGLSNGKDVLDANAKAQAAYALIMEQTSLAQGDFARTSGGVANQQRILKAQVDEAKTAFGKGLLPALEALAPAAGSALTAFIPLAESMGAGLGRAAQWGVDAVGTVSDALSGLRAQFSEANPAAGLAVELGTIFGWAEDSPQVDALAGAFGRVADTLGRAATSAADLAGQAADLAPTISDLTTLFQEQQDVIVPLAAGVGTFVGALATLSQVSSTIGAVKTAFALLGPAIATAMAPLLANPLTLVIAGIAGLGVALYVAYQKVEPFRNAVDAVARVIKDVALDAFDKLRQFAEQLGPAFARIGELGSTALSGLVAFGSGIIEAIQPALDWAQDNLVPAFAAAADFADALGDRIRNVAQIVSTVLSAAAKVVSTVFGAAWRVVGPVVMGVLRQWWNAFTTTAKIVKEVLGFAFDGLKLVVQTVFNAIKAVVESVLGTITGIFTVFAGVLRGDFGKVWEGLKQIVRAPLEAIAGFVEATFGNVLDFLGTIPGRLLSIGEALFSGFIEAIKIGLQTVWGVVSGGFGLLVDLVGALPGNLLTVAGNLFGFIVTQAQELLPKVGEWLSQIPGKVGDLAGSLLVQGLELGKAILNGIISGLAGLADQAGGLVGDLAGAAKDIALGIINALIGGLNSLFPDEIGAITVAGREVFGGIDLPDNPIPRIELARGGRVGARSGGVSALLGEAGWDELVLSTNPAMAGRNAGLLAGTGMADPALLNRIVSRVEQIAAVPRVGQLTLATASPQRHAIEFLDALDGAAWVRGA